MFTPLGLFKGLFCPAGQECSVTNCIFSHKFVQPVSSEHSAVEDTKTTAQNTETPEMPGAKRRKKETQAPNSTKDLPKPGPPPRLNGDGLRVPSPKTPAGNNVHPTKQEPSKLQTISRTVSPPPHKAESTPAPSHTNSTPAQPQSRPPPRRAPKERLNPRMIPKAPATHAVRLSILTKLHAAMSAQNSKIDKEKDGPNKYLVLTSDELVTMALDEEEKTAKESASVYSNVIKLRIVKLSKMSRDEWANEVKAHLNARYYKIAPAMQPQQQKALSTGMSSNEEIAVASQLITPLNGLEEYGWVTRAPTSEEIAKARKGVEESRGWEKCERCGGRFQVFPGRREDGSLTSGGPCTYHPGKPMWPPRSKTDHITGPKESYYPCCNETVGTSAGCTKGNTHVFKVSETKRLASVLPFQHTPAQPDKGPLPPIGIDCEMGYTTMGLELIRLTAVSWPEGKVVLDVLVRPVGEVLDLNSSFSGVFPEHYSKAVPYGSTKKTEKPVLEEGEIEPPALQVVESPAAARTLLFSLLQPDTPLIGHAIDNDLNACRIIHPTVIDTVLLYPHPKGLPIRNSLKMLSRRFLDREIQTGGSLGHDSKEDAIATGDLVRVKARETWTVLKSKGWRIHEDKLIPPPGASDNEWKLGTGAGQKRGRPAM